MPLELTPEKTMSVERFGPILLQATGSQPITDGEWASYIELIREDTKTNGAALLGIQYSLTQAPSAAQRKAAAELSATFSHFALISSSMLVRGAVTAISWLLRSKIETRAFAPSEVRAALEWLSKAQHFDVEEAFARLTTAAQAVGYTSL